MPKEIDKGLAYVFLHAASGRRWCDVKDQLQMDHCTFVVFEYVHLLAEVVILIEVEYCKRCSHVESCICAVVMR